MTPPRPLALPEPSTEQLAAAPLELVVCQVQHDRTLAVVDPARALAIHEDLAEVFGEKLALEEQAQHDFEVTAAPRGMPPIATTREPTKGWRLRSSDGAWIVALMPDFFALECTGYTTWSEFIKRFDALAASTLKHIQPLIEKRLGLRYLDRIFVPNIQSPQDWKGRINENLLGPILHETFGKSMIASQQVLHLEAPRDAQVILRHGVQRDGHDLRYFLDTDCYRSSSSRLELSSVVEGAKELHHLALQVFQASVTPEFLKVLERGASA